MVRQVNCQISSILCDADGVVLNIFLNLLNRNYQKLSYLKSLYDGLNDFVSDILVVVAFIIPINDLFFWLIIIG